MMTDEQRRKRLVRRVAEAIACEIARQDDGEIRTTVLHDGLTLPWLDQGEVDFGKVADAAIAEMERREVEF